MKALVIHAPRDLRLEDKLPSAAKDDELVIKTAVGGVCGSDLHYYNHGGFGSIKLKEPMILGHEVSGFVESVGKATHGFEPGELVSISPSRPCYACAYCEQGLHNHCTNMRFYGSAMPMPHIQGVFREQLTVKASQCVKATNLTAAEAAIAEPLSVVLHATKRAGDLLGKRVLITGCGPIGVLSVITARLAGAAEIIATDLANNAIEIAIRCGADQGINASTDTTALERYKENKGYFDAMFECSGSEKALASGIAMLRPRGVLMQLGLGGDMTLPLMQLTAKEIDLRGSFRFHAEFKTAVDLMSKGLIDVKPLITHTFNLTDAENAFKIANDRNTAMKTQIDFTSKTTQ